MTESEVKDYLLSGGAFWHWPTGIVIFYDEDFDEMCEKSDTFGVSVLNLSEMEPGGFEGVWSGYHASNDFSIDRDTAARIIAGTPEWLKTNDQTCSERMLLAKACFHEYARAAASTLHKLNQIATFEEE